MNFKVLLILFSLLFGLTECARTIASPTTASHTNSNHKQAIVKLGIYGFIQGGKVNSNNTVLTIELGSVQKVFSDGGKSWTSKFDSYEYLKYGAFFNWKGQNLGTNAFH